MVILLCMATHLHNPKMKDGYLRRTTSICENYIMPLINNERFYENIYLIVPYIDMHKLFGIII